MKSFLSISFLIHFAFFSMASILFSDFQKESLPSLCVEVTLYSWRIEGKKAKVSIKKEETETRPLPPQAFKVIEPISQEETPVRENIPVPSPEIEARENSVSEVPSLPVEDRKEEIRDEVPHLADKPIVLASLSPESVLTIQRESPSEPSPSPSQSPPAREEPRLLAKHAPPSEGEVSFVHPMYAQNPRPVYPREARRKGFQGEVVLRVEVLSNGLVGQVEVKKSSGHEILDRTALSAVKEWKFIPAKRGENAIPFWVNIPIKFQLQ
ncbi:MAG: energy transducer TonB [Thermodesulfobacteriota bacterium]